MTSAIIFGPSALAENELRKPWPPAALAHSELEGLPTLGFAELWKLYHRQETMITGTLTRLSESDIQEAGNRIPSVATEVSDMAAPQGTVVIGYLREAPNLDDLQDYLVEFARFVQVAVYFNGDRISQITVFGCSRARELLTRSRQQQGLAERRACNHRADV